MAPLMIVAHTACFMALQILMLSALPPSVTISATTVDMHCDEQAVRLA